MLIARRVSRSLIAGACSAAAMWGCGGPDDKPHADSSASHRLTPAELPVHAGTVEGFKQPESVAYDSASDVFFVSNINGDDRTSGGHGFISRVRADLTIDSLMFIAGGRGGVTLNAPRGLALVADTLWVADNDVVRAFNKHSGAPIATVDFRPLGAAFLNGIALGPDGALYITDTGPDTKSTATRGNRVFRIGAAHSLSVALHSDSLGSPNGITWDARGKRFIIVQWNGSHILAWHPGDPYPRTIGFGAPQMDGVKILADGRMVITSWRRKALIVRQGSDQTIIGGFESPADIGVDTRRQHVAVPLLTKNRVELWNIPAVKP